MTDLDIQVEACLQMAGAAAFALLMRKAGQHLMWTMWHDPPRRRFIAHTWPDLFSMAMVQMTQEPVPKLVPSLFNTKLPRPLAAYQG